MADWLRRSLAPLTDAAWTAIDETARRTLRPLLSARSVVDVDGPHGPEFAAVNLGRLEISRKKSASAVPWGIRQVQPLIEVRLPFLLEQMELDNITRGSADPDLSRLEAAARQLAAFEESAIYHGFADAQLKGLLASCSHKPLKLAPKPEQWPQVIGDGLKALRTGGIDGPFALVLSVDSFHALEAAGSGSYPPEKRIRALIQGPLLWSPALKGGVLLSTRGGDFSLAIGQDIAIGYASHDREQIELYLEESFTFRVLGPAAAVELKPPA